MQAVEKDSGDMRRREKERVMVQEGVALWNQEKARKRVDKIEDQKRVICVCTAKDETDPCSCYYLMTYCKDKLIQ